MSHSVAMGITTFLFNRILISRIGNEGVAAFTLVQYFSLISVMIYLGLNNGCQPIISYNYGAKLIKRVKQVIYRISLISLIIGIIFFVILNFFPSYLVDIFIKDYSSTRDLTIRASKFISYSLIFMPVGIIASMFFTSIENAKYSLLISLSRSLIFLVIALLVFPLVFGNDGIWISPLFAEFTSSILSLLLIFRWIKKELA